MNWFLEISSSTGDPQRHELTSDQATIGRSSTADIRLKDDTISRRHAKLSFSNDTWSITDLESKRGTKLNGKRIKQSKLKHGDSIGVGSYQLRLINKDHDPLRPQDTSIAMWTKTDQVNDITTIGSTHAPSIGLSHITAIGDLGHRLLDMNQSSDRGVALCELVTGSELKAQWATILEVQVSDWQPPLLLASSPPNIMDRQDVYVSRTTIDTMVNRGVSVLATNRSKHDFAIEMSIVDNNNSTAVIACPLDQEGETTRLLYLSIPTSHATTQWLAIMSLAAKEYQQAEAVWRKRNYDKIQLELDNARSIQQSILPKKNAINELDIDWSFRPCDAVGGDFVDVLKLPDGKIVITIADVSGHGLSAALATLSIHSILHSRINTGSSINDTMLGLNEHLCNFLPASRFVTMAIVLVDPQTGETQCISAGHHAPIVVSPDGECRELNHGSEMVLGIQESDYPSEQDQLNHGDTMLLYTDGLIEMEQANGGMLRTSGLTAHFKSHASKNPSASHITNELRDTLDTIQGSLPMADDQSFIVTRRR